MPEGQVEINEEVVNVTVTEGDIVQVDVTVSSANAQVETGVVGPQGPQGLPGGGATTLAALEDVNISQKIDKSILYYNQSSGKFVANEINTLITLTDGGNF